MFPEGTKKNFGCLGGNENPNVSLLLQSQLRQPR